MSKEEWMFVRGEVQTLFKQARQLADKKWEAAMILLGIEA
jgi:hypothetical protein